MECAHVGMGILWEQTAENLAANTISAFLIYTLTWRISRHRTARARASTLGPATCKS